MTAPTSRRAIEQACAVLRGLSAAQQTFNMYPPNHPMRNDVVEDIAAAARQLVTESDDAPVLFAARHNFYLGPALLARESLALTRLLRSFEDNDVEAVEVFDNVSEGDIDALLRILAGEGSAGIDMYGMAVNRVRPTLGVQGERERHLSEVLLTYGTGLELLRQTASRVSAGRPVDPESTRALVEQIVDDVGRDPMQALLVSTIKSYDEYTYYHMMNVTLLSIALGYGIGLEREQVVLLGMGALLHDIGKVRVPREILQQAGPLSDEQWGLIKRHPVDGAGLIYVATRDLYHPAISIVQEHHAGFDGSGYPALANDRMPSMPARIVSITDSFDALTSKRSYRQAEDRRQALNTLAASGQRYDPRVLRVFARLLGLFPVGSLVRLTTGETGMVVRNHESLLARPTVRLLLGRDNLPTTASEIDLSETGEDGEFTRAVENTVAPEELGLDMAALLKTGDVAEALHPAEGVGYAV
ncbi:MAG: HD domain-containing protein [Actinomycetota bacterium]|nr:HD domain-containing protein [Actinomycetota bacterium]